LPESSDIIDDFEDISKLPSFMIASFFIDVVSPCIMNGGIIEITTLMIMIKLSPFFIKITPQYYCCPSVTLIFVLFNLFVYFYIKKFILQTTVIIGI